MAGKVAATATAVKESEAKKNEVKGGKFTILVKCDTVAGVNQAMKWLEARPVFTYRISKN